MISNCTKNCMGTISFDGKFPGMRKPEEFIVYPMDQSGPHATIQSDHRFGRLNLDTGETVLSAYKKQYAGIAWLTVCCLRGTSTTFDLSVEDRQTLRQWIKSTGGLQVGNRGVYSDNTGALAL